MKKIMCFLILLGLILNTSALDAKLYIQLGPGFEHKYDYAQGMAIHSFSLDITDIYRNFGLKLTVSSLDDIAQPKYYYYNEYGSLSRFDDKTVFYSMGVLYSLDFLKVCRFSSYVRMGVSNIIYKHNHQIATYTINDDFSIESIGDGRTWTENSFTIGLGFGLEFEFSPFNIIPGLEFEYIHSFKEDVDFHMTRLCLSLAFDLFN